MNIYLYSIIKDKITHFKNNTLEPFLNRIIYPPTIREELDDFISKITNKSESVCEGIVIATENENEKKEINEKLINHRKIMNNLEKINENYDKLQNFQINNYLYKNNLSSKSYINIFGEHRKEFCFLEIKHIEWYCRGLLNFNVIRNSYYGGKERLIYEIIYRGKNISFPDLKNEFEIFEEREKNLVEEGIITSSDIKNLTLKTYTEKRLIENKLIDLNEKEKVENYLDSIEYLLGTKIIFKYNPYIIAWDNYNGYTWFIEYCFKANVWVCFKEEIVIILNEIKNRIIENDSLNKNISKITGSINKRDVQDYFLKEIEILTFVSYLKINVVDYLLFQELMRARKDFLNNQFKNLEKLKEINRTLNTLSKKLMNEELKKYNY